MKVHTLCFWKEGFAFFNKAIASLVLLFVAVILMTGCGPQSNSYSQGPTVMQAPTAPLTILEHDLKIADFHCDSSGGCPENVGLIFVETRTSYSLSGQGQCTGFLVADNIVATNSHCIPEAAKVSRENCSANIAIRFLDRGHTQTQGVQAQPSIFTCKRVLDFSPGGIMSPDYAFFEIASTGRQPVKIAQNGIADRSGLRVVKVTPNSPSYSMLRGGTMESARCTTALNTLLNIRSASPWSETAVAVDCAAVSGNSGSPVFNDRDEVVGILQSHMLEEWNSILKQNFSKYAKGIPSQIIPHFVFTNLSCVPDPLTKKFASTECQAAKNVGLGDCLNIESPENEVNGERALKSWNDSLSPIFVYKKIVDEKTALISAVPACVVPRKILGDQYDSFVQKVGVYGFRDETISMSHALNVKLGAKMQLDGHYRMMPQLEFSEDSRSYYQVELKKEGDVWVGRYFNPQTILGFEFSRLKFPLVVKDCTVAEVRTGHVEFVRMATGEEITAAEFKLRSKSKVDSRYCAI